MAMFAEIDKEAVRALPAALLTVGSTERQGYTERQAGFPDRHQILYVTGGEGLFTYGDRQETLGEGEGIFMRQGLPHSYGGSGERFSTRWCTFTLPGELLDFMGIGTFLRFPVTDAIRAETDALERLALGDSTPLSRSAAVYVYATELLSSLVRHRARVSDRAHLYLEQHYAESLTLSGIAEAVGVSRYRLSHLYREERGVTLTADLLSIRIAKAKRYLADLDDPVSSVAYMTGFDSPGYFTLCFRRAVGIPPLAYRAQKRRR